MQISTIKGRGGTGERPASGRWRRVPGFLVLLAGVLALGACVTTPTMSSSGGPPAGAGTPGSAGRPGSPGTTGQSGQTGSPGDSGHPGGTPAGTPAGQSAKTPGGADDAGSPAAGAAGSTDGRSRSGETAGSSGKSDEEILAEALAEFDRRNGTAAGAGDAPAGDKPAAGETAERGPGGTATRAEQTAMLEGDLDQRFAKFDEVMLQEREAVSKDDNAAGNRGFSDRSEFDGDEPGAGEDAMAPPAPNQGGSSASVPGKDVPADARKVYGEPPPDLASADGDDIIARQLREAAMKEPDPELREKLWDEYRKYKRSQK